MSFRESTQGARDLETALIDLRGRTVSKANLRRKP